MIVLGIDPGTTAVGYAVMEAARSPRLLAAGLIPIRAPEEGDRLRQLHEGMRAIISEWLPDVASVEKLFFSVNVKTAMRVSQARGVILLTAHLAGIRVYEYTPQEIKQTLTGDGSADKLQIKKMVKLTVPTAGALQARDDVFDAIASALACCFHEKLHLQKVE